MLDHRLKRGVHARRDGPAVALAPGAPRGRPGRLPPEHGDGHQRPGLLGEILPVLGSRAADGADGAGPAPPDGAGGRGPVRREHDRGRGHPGLDHGRQLRAGQGDQRRAGPTAADQGLRRPDPRRRGLRRVRRPVPAAVPGVGLPGAAGGVHQRLRAQVRPGLPGRRLGGVARAVRAAGGPRLQRELPGRPDADVRAELLPARLQRHRAVLQLPPARLQGLPRRAAGLPGRRRLPVLGASPRSARSSCSARARSFRSSRSSSRTA